MVEVEEEAAPLPTAATAAPEPPPEDAAEKPTKPGRPPSQKTLRVRVAKLEAALTRATPKGARPDAALAALARHRQEVAAARSPAARARAAKRLDEWEKTWLR